VRIVESSEPVNWPLKIGCWSLPAFHGILGSKGEVMITERGVIEKVIRQKAWVRIQKGAACASCSQRGTCRMESDRPTIVEVDNELSAKDGDWVEVSMPTRSLMKISFVVYFIPVLALVVSALIGAQWAASLQISPTAAAIASGAIALSVCFVLVRRFDRAVRTNPDYHPRMTKILANEAASGADCSR
jgi:sigma-E factor negative regulatory protein RseC